MIKQIYIQVSPLYRIIGLCFLISAAVFSYAQIAGSNSDKYGLAQDLPAGALVYAQFEDLPALFSLWEQSEIKQKYLESVNYDQFSLAHLGQKIGTRLGEFEEAGNFPLDTAALISSTETSAAVAVYDIGRLELVLVAPLSQEKMLASEFVLNKNLFEETELEDGTIYYSTEVNSDRGRQNQKLLFAAVNGRFILATDEVNFLRSIALINGRSKAKSLFEEPAFRALTKKLSPHLATVWVDQAKLNEDWYFRHYWAFKNLEDLKNIRAGIFDFEISSEKLTEHRLFLGQTPLDQSKLSADEINSLQKFLPADIPYFKIYSVKSSSPLTADLVHKTLFDGLATNGLKKNKTESRPENYYYSDYEEDHWSEDYRYLGQNYNIEITETRTEAEFDEAVWRDPAKLLNELGQILTPARPRAAAGVISPQIMPMPFFFEARRALVLSIENPAGLNRENLERVISALAQNHLSIKQTVAELNWQTTTQNGQTVRELKMPLLGWSLLYALRGNELIFANSPELLSSMLENKSAEIIRVTENLDDLTVIRLDQRDPAFDAVMQKINETQKISPEYRSPDLFADNIASLLDTVAAVSRIEIKRHSDGEYLAEEIEFVLITD